MENVVVISASDVNEARTILEQLERLEEQTAFEVEAAAIVEATEEGGIVIVEEEQRAGAGATAAGVLLGGILGLVTGPTGLLVGGASGALLGSVIDAADAEDARTIVDDISRSVPPRTAAVVAAVVEAAPGRLNRVVADHGATLVRRPRVDVERELLAAEEAVLAVQRRAGRDLPISERVRDVKDSIKEALTRSR